MVMNMWKIWTTCSVFNFQYSYDCGQYGDDDNVEWQKLRWPRQPGASEECQPFEREDDDDDENEDDEEEEEEGEEYTEY